MRRRLPATIQEVLSLILQLRFHAGFTLAAAPVACPSDSLVYASPERPFEEAVEHDANGALEAADEMAD
ncbi:hypothetical protein, partial [Roseomonas harenae]|uniref:hypothetical protein n=1 Tax=Muricoccus harenae TaxID=2692566 RepID=UPI001F208AD5